MADMEQNHTDGQINELETEIAKYAHSHISSNFMDCKCDTDFFHRFNKSDRVKYRDELHNIYMMTLHYTVIKDLIDKLDKCLDNKIDKLLSDNYTENDTIYIIKCLKNILSEIRKLNIDFETFIDILYFKNKVVYYWLESLDYSLFEDIFQDINSFYDFYLTLNDTVSNIEIVYDPKYENIKQLLKNIVDTIDPSNHEKIIMFFGVIQRIFYEYMMDHNF